LVQGIVDMVLVSGQVSKVVGLDGHPFHRLKPAERPLETEVREIYTVCDATENSRPQGVDVSLESGLRKVATPRSDKEWVWQNLHYKSATFLVGSSQ
jgi:hypothetical protein